MINTQKISVYSNKVLQLGSCVPKQPIFTGLILSRHRLSHLPSFVQYMRTPAEQVKKCLPPVLPSDVIIIQSRTVLLYQLLLMFQFSFLYNFSEDSFLKSIS